MANGNLPTKYKYNQTGMELLRIFLRTYQMNTIWHLKINLLAVFLLSSKVVH